MSLAESIFELWHAYRWHALVLAAVLSLGARFYYTRNGHDESYKPSEKSSVQPHNGDGILVAPLEKQVADREILKPQPARQTLPGPKRIVGRKAVRRKARTEEVTRDKIQPLIFYGSIGGTTEHTANSLAVDISSNTTDTNILPPQLLDLAHIDYEDYFTSLPKHIADSDGPVSYFYILLVPTYNIDTILDNFLEHLKEVHHDFRIDTAPLRSLLGYAVFGLGDKEGWPTQEEGFCSQAIDADKWMARLTESKRAYPLGMGDVKTDADDRLRDWRIGVLRVMEDLASGNSLGEGVPGSGEAIESDEEDEESGDFDLPNKAKRRKAVKSTMADLEVITMGLPDNNLSRPPLPVDFTTISSQPNPKQDVPAQPKEMVPISSPTHAALTKQGYSIIGSHSGVKICRWTKSALRGRGSCYKYSFYGIASHLCMETTPSLSCSNKCVFCWRHGTNPVGTTWRWVVDPPDLVFEGVKKAHYSKIKMMRGVPGVRAERFEEAMQIRHCALSLVGEPIFYPHINEFVGMLHAERISSFLVCNAQHPEQLASLRRVTQLYVSIDASNKESLKKIDRPLHRDFWERFNRCLEILREKRFMQRTVFRLTLVKGFNIEDEAEGYADLVEKGLPCFVEVKGVTYCGTSTSKGAGLSMQNVPFYEEVCAFVIALNAALERRGLQYGIAAEHAHSCCILLASERFSANGRWNTTIDYARFFQLLESGVDFRPEDYMAETQEFALWGNGGFDPRDERVRRKGKNKT